MKSWFGVLAIIFPLLLLGGCNDVYSNLLAKQGYTAVDHPRAEFGTGTIIKIQGNREEIFIASADECFPGLSAKIHPNPIQLIDAKDTSNLSVDVGGKYVPGGVEQIGGSLGFKSIKTLDVSFGKTTGNDLTVEGFAQYLDKAKVSKRCLGYLTNKENHVILSAARVDSMAFTFHGEKDVNGKVDDSALKNTLTANGVLSYTSTTDHTLSVSQPMYIGYRSFQFNDLGIIQTESPDSPVELQRTNFKLTLDQVRQ
jgi:hypothetical protein